MNNKKNIAGKIEKIKWFSNCGNELTEKINLDILYVNSWNDSQRYYQDCKWESTTLEASNTLTSFLHKRYPNRYTEWNLNVKKAKEILNQDLLPKLIEFRRDKSLEQLFIDCVLWDILAAYMEEIYKDCKDRPTFFLELFKVYEQGNFPCGWEGEWPLGRLIIY